MIDARASRGISDGDRKFGEEEEGKTKERSRDAMGERKRACTIEICNPLMMLLDGAQSIDDDTKEGRRIHG
ncbi:hypothetical protein L2E82_17604 [Cichorium intybus]|uniref:Uncharacterized protein n=1 Tax=Cichorium intybus TaxID=13427 RepID=A0ACB9F9X8_CICIN|nr:hypothetical protein L2E82_17604 [Cichorium intybus]